MHLNAIAAGEGPPVLLLHGLFGSAQNWGAIQKALAARHRVVALDLRNHGASPRAAAMDYRTLAADVAETMGGPAAVLGHSMGGKVAMALALARPDLVTRLVVADIAPVTYAPALRGHVAAMQALPLAPGLTRRAADAALASAVPEAAIRAFLLQNLRFDGAVPSWRLGLAEIAAAMPAIESFPDDLPGPFPGPVLALRGGRSPYVTAAGAAGLRALFPACDLCTLEGAGHWLHAEQPAAFLDAVGPFLGG